MPDQRPASSGPRVSVVVASYNRAHLLPRLFEALAQQTVASDDFELVIVDDASSDDTQAVLADLAAGSAFATRVLLQPRNAGPAAARNRGTAAAISNIIAFTDDDCVPSPGWLAAGLDRAGVGRIVVGRTEPSPTQPMGPFSRTLRVTNARFMQTCNIFYARDEVLEVGGFDERFRGAAGEDTDLGFRLQARGAQAEFCESALVHHDVRPSDVRAAVREAWSKWIDLPLVIKQHPHARSRLRARLFWKDSHVFVVIAIAGLLALPATWLGLLGLVPWVLQRTVRAPLDRSLSGRLRTLPGAMVIDLCEVVAMVRGSLRHRTLML